MEIIEGKRPQTAPIVQRSAKTSEVRRGEEQLCQIPENGVILETKKYKRGTGPEAEMKMKRVQRRCHQGRPIDIATKLFFTDELSPILSTLHCSNFWSLEL